MEIERSETGIRILYTILFLLAIQVVEFVLGVAVLFQLAFALVTRTAPPERVREFAERVIRYAYQVAQYLTWNRDRAPFPFDDFPPDPGQASAPTSP